MALLGFLRTLPTDRGRHPTNMPESFLGNPLKWVAHRLFRKRFRATAAASAHKLLLVAQSPSDLVLVIARPGATVQSSHRCLALFHVAYCHT